MKKFFSSGQELANLVVSSDVLDICFDALSKPPDQQTNAPGPFSPAVRYRFDEYGSRNVLAFKVSPSDVGDGSLLGLGQEQGALIKEHFSFISPKDNTSFSVDKTAIDAFVSLSHCLHDLKEKINSLSKTLIVTGQALAGSLACLFTLWLQHNVIEPKTSKIKRLVCITFGSPLVGDGSFSKAISEQSSLSSCFVHVVSSRDPVPRLFLSTHRPFGTYLFCSESGGCACFDDSESIYAVMSTSVQNNTGTVGYRTVLEAAKANTLFRGSSPLGDFNGNPLHEGIKLQLVGIEALNPQVDTIGTDTLIKDIAGRQERLIIKKRNVYEPTKALNDMKINLTRMEGFMKRWRSRAGYYDTYKDPQGMEETRNKQDTVKPKRKLVQYWKGVVEEKEKMPQKEGRNMRVRWLYGGTNYRRIIEPLDIAEYYKEGKTDYLSNRGSSQDYRHYKLLEDWFNEDKKLDEPKQDRKEAANLTEDSCFWAHVEEAIISLNALKRGGENAGQVEKLEKFKKYILKMIEEKTVSPDIFLPGSSFMQWWGDYKEIMLKMQIRQPTDHLFQPGAWAKEYK